VPFSSSNAFAPVITGGGLSLHVEDGVLFVNGVLSTIAAADVVLAANTTNYVYVDLNTGLVTVGLTLPADSFPIATVITGVNYIRSLVDSRADVAAASGAGLPVTSGDFVTNGLVLAFKFNEGTGQVTTDLSPSALNGTLGTGSGSDSRDPTWVSPRGLLFDGVDDRVFVNTPNTALRLTTALSVEISLKFSASGGVWDKTGGDVTNKNYLLIVGNPTTTFRLVKATINQDLAVTTTGIIVGGNYHFVATWDGTNMVLYQDGVQVGQKVVTASIDDVDGIFTIGALGNNVQPFAGTIYKLSVYNRALTHKEVRVLYEAPGF
jgi:hypothetical protein